MEKVLLTCIECPQGCSIEVQKEGNTVISVTGNSCPRGKIYATNEVICPMRTVTSTVKTSDGKLVPVKTDKPVRKTEIFFVMKKINACVAKIPVKIGDIICENISGDANLVASGNYPD